VIRVDRRDDLSRPFEGEGDRERVYYPVPFHMQKCYAGLGHKEGDFPASESAARESLALPIYPELTDGMIAEVVGVVAIFVR